MISLMGSVNIVKLAFNKLSPPSVRLIPVNFKTEVSGGVSLLRLSKKLRSSVNLDGQGDNGYIEGVVTEEGIAVSRRVMCYSRRTGILVGTTYSKPNGEYRFDNLVSGLKYFITSIDEDNSSVQYSAVTQDLIAASGLEENFQVPDDVEVVADD